MHVVVVGDPLCGCRGNNNLPHCGGSFHSTCGSGSTPIHFRLCICNSRSERGPVRLLLYHWYVGPWFVVPLGVRLLVAWSSVLLLGMVRAFRTVVVSGTVSVC